MLSSWGKCNQNINEFWKVSNSKRHGDREACVFISGVWEKCERIWDYLRNGANLQSKVNEGQGGSIRVDLNAGRQERRRGVRRLVKFWSGGVTLCVYERDQFKDLLNGKHVEWDSTASGGFKVKPLSVKEEELVFQNLETEGIGWWTLKSLWKCASLWVMPSIYSCSPDIFHH